MSDEILHEILQGSPWIVDRLWSHIPASIKTVWYLKSLFYPAKSIESSSLNPLKTSFSSSGFVFHFSIYYLSPVFHPRISWIGREKLHGRFPHFMGKSSVFPADFPAWTHPFPGQLAVEKYHRSSWASQHASGKHSASRNPCALERSSSWSSMDDNMVIPTCQQQNEWISYL